MNTSCPRSTPWTIALPRVDLKDLPLYELTFSYIRQPFNVLLTDGWGHVHNGTATHGLGALQQRLADLTSMDYTALQNRLEYFPRIVPSPFGSRHFIITNREDAKIIGGFNWPGIMQLDGLLFTCFLVLVYAAINTAIGILCKNSSIRLSLAISFLIIEWHFCTVLLSFQINRSAPPMSGIRDLPAALNDGMVRVSTVPYNVEKGYSSFIKLAEFKEAITALEKSGSLVIPAKSGTFVTKLYVSKMRNHFTFTESFYYIQFCGYYPPACSKLTAVPLFDDSDMLFVTFFSDQFSRRCVERYGLASLMLSRFGIGRKIAQPGTKNFRTEQERMKGGDLVHGRRKISFGDVSAVLCAFVALLAMATVEFVLEHQAVNRLLDNILRTLSLCYN